MMFAALDSKGTILPWQISLALAFSLLAYSTYAMVTKYDRNEALKYAIPAWIVFVAIGYWGISSGLKL